MYNGKLIRLREYRKEDIPQVLEYLNNPDIRQFMMPTVPFPMVLHDEEKWFSTQSFTRDNYNFAIETLEDKVYLGGCGLLETDWKNRHTGIGIFIGNEQYLGKGYGTDAIITLLNFIFSEMNLNKVHLEVYAFNKRAIRSYEKAGFTVEGVFKDAMFRHNAYHDVVRMAIFGEDFYKNIWKD